jgi:hypothetical protein
MRYENPMTFRYAINMACHIDAACFFTTGAGHSIGSLHTRPNPVADTRHGKIVAQSKGEKYVHIHLRGKKKEIDRIKYVNLGCRMDRGN